MRTTDAYKRRIRRIQELTQQLQTVSSELYLISHASLNIPLVLQVVENIFGSNPLEQSRKARIVDAKIAVTYILKEYTAMNELAISQAVGGKEHSTVYYRYTIARNRIDTEPDFKEKIQRCKEKILLLM